MDNDNLHMIEEMPINVLTQDWDVLIILDACRYDKFEQVYKEFFNNGTLYKAVSPATYTPEFLYKIFKDAYLKDTIYVSANAFVNSKNVPICDYDFVATPHFKKVIDVWYHGWNEKLGTVHPKDVNLNAIATMDLNRSNRFIIHYMQPHYPFLFYGGDITQQKLTDYNLEIKQSASRLTQNRSSLVEKFKKFMFKHISEESIWTFADFWGIRITNGMGLIWLEYDEVGFIKGYVENIKIVLRYVKKLVELYPKKKFLIISDHGEWLGEKGIYGHFKTHRREFPTLLVPWFEIGGDT